MAAATANVDTKEFTFAGQIFSDRVVPVKAATKIYAGTIVALDASGFAAPATTATGLIILGVATAQADNSAGTAGAINVNVRPGVFKMANLTSSIVQADLGKTCYVTDDSTVSKTDGGATKSAAGKIFQVDSDGVWVAIGFLALFT